MNQKAMQLVHNSDLSELISSLIQERLQQYQDRIDSLQIAYLSKSNKLHKLEKELTYKSGYDALKKSKDPVLTHHIITTAKHFYLSNSPLMGLLINRSP